MEIIKNIGDNKIKNNKERKTIRKCHQASFLLLNCCIEIVEGFIKMFYYGIVWKIPGKLKSKPSMTKLLQRELYSLTAEELLLTI